MRKLAADLRNNGHTVWIDEAEINLGDSLIEKIATAIDKVGHIVAIISKNSVRSNWVRKELGIAISREIEGRTVNVIPILTDNVSIPSSLVDKKYGDLRRMSDFEVVLSEIARAVSQR